VKMEPLPQLVKSDSLSGSSKSELDVPPMSCVGHLSRMVEKGDVKPILPVSLKTPRRLISCVGR
jgi:hypothetical protein